MDGIVYAEPNLHWSWQRLKAEVASDAVGSLFYEGRPVSEAYIDCYYTAAGTIMLFGLLGMLCRALNIAAYRSLSDVDRLIFVSHIAFLLIFLATSVPYSIVLVNFLFAPTAPAVVLQPANYRSITYPLAFQLNLYMFEGAFRSVVRINRFLILHHLMFCTLTVLAFQSQSVFLLKLDIIVSVFATYEFGLYAALLSRKMASIRFMFEPLVFVGVGFYLLTRLVQAALLVGLFVLGYSPMRRSKKNIALYWVGMFMCVALVMLQMYTFVIYYAIWSKDRLKAKTFETSSILSKN